MTRWQIYCAVALRRLPDVIPRKDPIEIKVQRIFDAHECSMSRYSQHEIDHERELRLKDSSESGVILKETAQDRLDKWMKEKSEFQFAEYDDRLSKTHFLFVKTKFGTDIKDQWLLPQAVFDRSNGDRDLMDTARRALKEHLDIVNGFTIISKIPSSHYSFKYPKKLVESIGFDGAKVFYLKANLDGPDRWGDKNDLRWVTREEARNIVKSNYLNGLEKGLLHENKPIITLRSRKFRSSSYNDQNKSISL